MERCSPATATLVATRHLRWPVRIALLRQIIGAVLLSLCVSSCAVPPPPIGRDLPSTVADARPAFDQRVRERFAAGASEQDLIAELRREGFTLIPANGALPPFKSAATYTSHQSFACSIDWTVLWSAENGKLTAVAGQYHPICL
jgi:hypothetical protein